MAGTATFLVFAYGSNMLTRRLSERCTSATALGVAELEGHELRWDKRSQDGSGKCHVVETDRAAAVVFGVLYRIAERERPTLDRAEGLGSGYEEKAMTVTCNGELRGATIYYATRIDESLRPYTWYKALVVAGAKEHGLPAAYVAQLESAKATDDPDCERHAKSIAMVNGTTATAQ